MKYSIYHGENAPATRRSGGLVFATDADAMSHAQSLVRGEGGFEVWREGHLVGRVKHGDKSAEAWENEGGAVSGGVGVSQKRNGADRTMAYARGFLKVSAIMLVPIAGVLIILWANAKAQPA